MPIDPKLWEETQELFAKLTKKEDPEEALDRIFEQARARMYTEAFTMALTFGWDELRGRSMEDAFENAQSNSYILQCGGSNLGIMVAVPS